MTSFGTIVKFYFDFILSTMGNQRRIFMQRSNLLWFVFEESHSWCWYMNELERGQEWKQREHLGGFIATWVRGEVEWFEVGLAGGWIWVIVGAGFIKSSWRIESRGEIRDQVYLRGLGLKQLEGWYCHSLSKWDLRKEEEGQPGGVGG